MTHHRPDLAPHLIATRVIGNPWPENNITLEAREDHEAGRVDMATGRHEGHEYLYAIPRRVREVGRRPWFSRADFAHNEREKSWQRRKKGRAA